MDPLPGDPQALEAELRSRLQRMRLADPFAVLGLAPDADAAGLRRAYLDLTRSLHPAKFARHGEKIRELVNEVFLLVRRAHDQLEPDDKRKAWRDRVKPSAPATLRPQPTTISPPTIKPAGSSSGSTTPSKGLPSVSPPTGPLPVVPRPGLSSPSGPSGPQTVRPQSQGLAGGTGTPSPAGGKPALSAGTGPGARPTPTPGPPTVRPGLSPPTVRPGQPLPGVNNTARSPLTGRPLGSPSGPVTRPGSPTTPPGMGARGLSPPTTPPQVAHGIEAAKAATRDREHRYDQAQKFLLSGQARAAREVLFQIASEEPGNRRYRAALHMAWGFEHVAGGKLQEAQRELEKAMALDPENEDCRGALSKVHDELAKQQKGGLLGKLFKR